MDKKQRESVHNKFNGHCAYCGKEIGYKEMQVDHLIPKWHTWTDRELERHNKYVQSLIDNNIPTNAKKIMRGADSLNNYMPACRRCNYNKSTLSIEEFRKVIAHKPKVLANNTAYKMAIDYGLITENPVKVTFYFEKVDTNKPVK